jgi:hypothetical protein
MLGKGFLLMRTSKISIDTIVNLELERRHGHWKANGSAIRKSGANESCKNSPAEYAPY